MLYFAYASNLSTDYMQERCPNATAVKKVALKNYKLVFNELADIIQHEEDHVLGALYVVSKQDLEELDRLEGFPDLYDRLVVEVEDEEGGKYDAYAYSMVEKDLQDPPEHYYKILLEGYKDWNLPQDNLEKAKNRE